MDIFSGKIHATNIDYRLSMKYEGLVNKKVIKQLYYKMAMDLDGVSCEFLKGFKEEFIIMVHKLFLNIERGGKFSNDNVTLVPKLNKDSATHPFKTL